MARCLPVLCVLSSLLWATTVHARIHVHHPPIVAPDGFRWQLCDAGGSTTNQPFNISNVQLAPNPAVHGQNLTTSLLGVSDRSLPDATLSVTVYFFGLPVKTTTGHLCDPEATAASACPIKAGFLSITSIAEIPKYAPPGKYSMRLKAAEIDSKAALMCLDVWFKVTVSPRTLAAM